MTKRVQFIRHDNAGASAFQGKLGEITVNTGNKSVHVHDGINAGGTEQARADLVNVAVATAGNVGKMSAQQAAELAQSLLDIVTNAGNITSNDVDIAANLAAILSNDTDIATNAGNISTNTGDITTNAGNIATNLATIIAHTAAIALNTAKLTANTTNVRAAGALMDDEVDLDIKSLSLPASTTISAFGRTLIDDAAASNARTTLGLLALATRNTVGSAQIDANSVGDSELKTAIGSTGSQLIVTNGTWLPSAGYYNFAQDLAGGSGVATFEIQISSVWYLQRLATLTGFYWCDGTNMRIHETSGSSQTIVKWQKLG